MFNKIRELAQEALNIQNKIVMEEALKEIVLMCGEKAMSEESISYSDPEFGVLDLSDLPDISHLPPSDMVYQEPKQTGSIELKCTGDINEKDKEHFILSYARRILRNRKNESESFPELEVQEVAELILAPSPFEGVDEASLEINAVEVEEVPEEVVTEKPAKLARKK
jgi:hypothetical protein